ncbi:MAG: transglycosylase SLT domain-containing protein [Fibromonadaceae bacterium]|jgi:soluble lytic murein transglycosylase|nr:transglycosylase SLT domain-containing protein [Fibromonadaceae bacterium]
MKSLFLILLTLCISVAVAQNSDNDNELELLPPDAFKNEVLRRELALQGIENTKDSFSKELLRASVLFYDKKWDSAFAAYTPLLEKAPSLLYGPIVIRLARCELERGNIQESRKILLSIKSIKSNKNLWDMVDRVLVDGIMRDTAISHSAKKDSLQQRLNSKSNSTHERFLKLKLASLEEKEKNTAAATTLYLSLLRYSDQHADSAFGALLRLAPESEDYNFVTTLCKRRYHERCADKITSILAKKTKPDSAKRIAFMEMRAEAWKQLNKNELAIEQYKKLLDSVDYNAVWMQNLQRIVRSTGNKKEAKRLDSIFQRKFPFSAENANNLWVKAFELEQAKNYEEAINVYKKLYDPKFGKHKSRQWAKFRVGFINYKEGRYAEAADIFAESAKEYLGLMPRSAALYFYAECQRMLASENMVKAYNAVIADFPLGYYSWRARHILKYELSENIPKFGVEMTDSAAIVWLRALQKKEANEKDSLVSVERLEQISILLRSGFEREAYVLYNEALEYHKNRPEFYYRYGMMFMQNGEYALAHRLARNFIDLVSREKMTGIPLQVLKFLFPIPHEAKVRKHAKIDPFLIYSVMRQESMFDALITSPAGARGLLQIMPATGDVLARSEGIKKFNKDMLYNSYMNIRLGIRYLNDLYNEYKGDYIGILGNYNAGPAPAVRWMTNHGPLPWDIRVEEVSYWETRDYVKRVLGNYWTYRELYGEN